VTASATTSAIAPPTFRRVLMLPLLLAMNGFDLTPR
jgi:hypothetical protein